MTSLMDIKHGASTAYMNHRCRCDECKLWMKGYNALRRESMRSPRPVPEHNTRARYRRGCRCGGCIGAYQEDQRQRYVALTDEQRAERRAGIDRGKDNARGRRYYADNREQEKAKRRAHYAANKDYYYSLVRKRQALKRGVTVEFVDRRVVWDRDGGVCHLCQKPADQSDWHLDHVYPLAAGGEHSYANTAVTHPRCNREKGAKIP